MIWHHNHKNRAGFTLIELVVVIVIVGILSVLGGQFIVAPMTGYVDLSRRVRLVDQAEMSLRRMQRDIRAALPNSIVTAAGSVTMINTVDGGRYRRYVDPDADCTNLNAEGCNILTFTENDTSFEVLGGMGNDPQGTNFTDRGLVIYNVVPAFPSEHTKIDECKSMGGAVICNFESIKFINPSPYQRFFIVDSQTTYTCDLAAEELRRVSTKLDGSDPSSAVVTRGISDCEFTYSPGTTQRAGLVTLRLTLEEAEEEITLLHQVHVVNAP